MNMVGYLLGSGIMDKPYVFEIAVCICVMMVFAYLAIYGFKRAAAVRNEWMSWCVAFCGGIAFTALLSACFFFGRLCVSEKKQEPFEMFDHKNENVNE